MQSYQEFERQQSREIMENDPALKHLRDVSVTQEQPIPLEDFLKQDKPESVVDKSYRLHQNQRKTNKRVNLAFNRLAFSVKQQISQDRQGERHGNVD